MADDSDIGSWYSKKQDRFVQYDGKIGSITRPPSTTFEFDDSISSTSHNGILGFSNGGYALLPNYDERRPKSSQSVAPEVRFINPAIYAESLNDQQDSALNSHTVQVLCGDSSDLTEGFSALSVNEKSPRSGGGDHSDQTAADTYRCSSESETSRTSTLTLANHSKSATRLIRRCTIGESSKIYLGAEDEDPRRYSSIIPGRDRGVQFSSGSLSNSSLADSRTSGSVLARRIAHQEWVRKKQRTAMQRTEKERRAELERREKEDRFNEERRKREQRERENFLRWQERKKREEANRRLAVGQELDLQKRLKAVEDQAAYAKVIHLRQWARGKETAQKAQQREEELKRKTIAEERKKRLEQSSQAFERWRENAKGRPRPATQGLLPHQRARPSFVNPEPWQRVVDNSADQTLGLKDLSSENVTGAVGAPQ